MTTRYEVKVYDGEPPHKDETPDHYLMRIHESEERALRLLEADRPEPSADFDERFADRLAAVRIIERAEALEADEAPPPETPRLDALLARDRPEPSPQFDATLRFRWRRAMSEDSALRLPGADVLRIPALPNREMPLLDAARAKNPMSPGRIRTVLVLAAASLAATIWFTIREQALDPPDEELGMVAHLDLLERYEEVEALDALEDEEVFEVVALLDTLETPEKHQ